MAAFAAYALLAIAITWPLAAGLATSLPGTPRDTDVFGFVWNNWWIAHAITSLHTSPLTTGFIFAPFEIDLRLHTLGLFYGLASIPITFTAGPVAALNLQALATMALNGWAARSLALDVTADRRAAFCAGLLVAATPAINFHVDVGRPSCAAVWPAIFAIRALRTLFERPSLTQAFRLGAWLVVTLTVDQQVALFGILWLATFVGAEALRHPGRFASRSLLYAAVGVAVVVVPVGVWLYVVPFGSDGYTVPSPGEALTYSYPAALLWTPAMLWRAYGAGLTLACAAVLLLRRLPGIRPWALGALFFVALTFGPILQPYGMSMPFALLAELPGVAQFRTPYRFQIPAAIGLAIAAAVSLASINRSGARIGTRLAVAVGALVVVDALALRSVKGFAVQHPKHHPVYEQIGALPPRGVLLEIPVGVRTGTDRIGAGETLTFHQSAHQRPLVNGFAARVPLAALASYRASPALMWLAGEPPPSGDLAQDLALQLQRLRVEFVVLHPALIDATRRSDTIALLSNTPDLSPYYNDADVMVWHRPHD